MIYLRARYYDPASGRFTQEDPAKDGLNWYAYCGNNPVMFIDRTGLSMTLTGTGDEVSTIWGCLNELTDDELVLTQDRVEVGDSQYELLDSYTVTVGKENSGSLEVGTSMIRRIIADPLACIISVDNSTGGSSRTKPINPDAYVKGGISTGARVTLFTASDISVLTRDDDGNTQYEAMPRYLSLGHELIHTLRLMGGNGKALNETNKGKYAYTDLNGKVYEKRWFYEELETTGISYTKADGTNVNAWTWYTSENTLRDEHGLNRRVLY